MSSVSICEGRKGDRRERESPRGNLPLLFTSAEGENASGMPGLGQCCRNSFSVQTGAWWIHEGTSNSREGPPGRVQGIRKEKTLEGLSTEDSQAARDVAVDVAVLSSIRKNTEQEAASIGLRDNCRDAGADTCGEARTRSDVAGAGKRQNLPKYPSDEF